MIHYRITKTIHDNEARYIFLIPSLTSEKPLLHFNSEVPESVTNLVGIIHIAICLLKLTAFYVKVAVRSSHT